MGGDFWKVPRPENAYDATSDAGDGLDACRGLRSAVIIEALAGGLLGGVALHPGNRGLVEGVVKQKEGDKMSAPKKFVFNDPGITETPQMDFPQAFEFIKQNALDKNEHHPKCSYRQAGMLCDCSILWAEYYKRRVAALEAQNADLIRRKNKYDAECDRLEAQVAELRRALAAKETKP